MPTMSCKHSFNTHALGMSLVVQWLRLHAPKAGGPGSFSGQGMRSHMPQLQRFRVLHLRLCTV